MLTNGGCGLLGARPLGFVGILDGVAILEAVYTKEKKRNSLKNGGWRAKLRL